jgi:hypothetical protein
MAEMENSRIQSPLSALARPETMYCCDPNCRYCKELREAEEQLNRVKSSGGSRQVRDFLNMRAQPAMATA